MAASGNSRGMGRAQVTIYRDEAIIGGTSHDVEELRQPLAASMGRAAAQHPVLQAWDLNRDGTISEEEMVAAANEHMRLKNLIRGYRALAWSLAALMLLALIAGSAGHYVHRQRFAWAHKPLYKVPDLLALYKVDPTHLHRIKFASVCVPNTKSMVFFRVDAMERTFNSLILQSGLGREIVITNDTVTYYKDDQIVQAHTPLSVRQGRHLLASASPPPAGKTDCCLIRPCCG